jgi:hypothetical protein
MANKIFAIISKRTIFIKVLFSSRDSELAGISAGTTGLPPHSRAPVIQRGPEHKEQSPFGLFLL